MFARPPPEQIGGLRVKPSDRARRLSLRVEARTGEVVLVWPRRASARRAERFVEENRAWIARHEARGAPVPVAPGAALSVFGCEYVVEHRVGRGLSKIEAGRIVIHGDPAHLPRRLKDFLKAEAEKILVAAVREKTQKLGLPFREVRIRDPRSRWGSCGPDGRIMLSWRLVLAPPAVMDYVVAHEVAHRVHMNHGRAFWRLCLSLCDEAQDSRRWLRANGQGLLGLV